MWEWEMRQDQQAMKQSPTPQVGLSSYSKKNSSHSRISPQFRDGMNQRTYKTESAQARMQSMGYKGYRKNTSHYNSPSDYHQMTLRNQSNNPDQ
jgi:hypothetical protein